MSREDSHRLSPHIRNKARMCGPPANVKILNHRGHEGSQRNCGSLVALLLGMTTDEGRADTREILRCAQDDVNCGCEMRLAVGSGGPLWGVRRTSVMGCSWITDSRDGWEAPICAESRASLVFFWPNNKCGMPHVWRFSRRGHQCRLQPGISTYTAGARTFILSTSH